MGSTSATLGRVFAILGCVTALTFGVVAPASAQDTLPSDFAGVPERTSLVLQCGGTRLATANANESRTGLSEVKLFIADYALRRGDGSPDDRALSQDMIEASNDYDASIMDSKYPGAIDAIADEYGLTSTARGSFWGDSYTSASDLVTFLEGLKARHPDSPILAWMTTSTDVAADGTVQDWGTSRLLGVQGTKFGWADDISTAVASASIGPGFSVAAITLAGPSEQSVDVDAALGGIDLARDVLPAPVPVGPPALNDIIRQLFGR